MNQITIGDIVRGDREVFPPYLYEAYQSTRRRAPTLPLIDMPLTLSELTGPGPAISARCTVLSSAGGGATEATGTTGPMNSVASGAGGAPVSGAAVSSGGTGCAGDTTG